MFQTAFQTAPLDLHTDAFFPARQSEIAHRLAAIANGDAERIIRAVHAEHASQQTCIVGLDWSFELADLLEIVRVRCPLSYLPNTPFLLSPFYLLNNPFLL